MPGRKGQPRPDKQLTTMRCQQLLAMQDNPRARGREARTSVALVLKGIPPQFYVYMVIQIFARSMLEVLELHAIGRQSILAATKIAGVLSKSGHAVVRGSSFKPVPIGNLMTSKLILTLSKPP